MGTSTSSSSTAPTISISPLRREGDRARPLHWASVHWTVGVDRSPCGCPCPVVSIASIRGRAGRRSEFVWPATAVRLAREHVARPVRGRHRCAGRSMARLPAWSVAAERSRSPGCRRSGRSARRAVRYVNDLSRQPARRRGRCIASRSPAQTHHSSDMGRRLTSGAWAVRSCRARRRAASRRSHSQRGDVRGELRTERCPAQTVDRFAIELVAAGLAPGRRRALSSDDRAAGVR